MNTKKITSIFALICFMLSCFAGVVCADEIIPEAISAETVCTAILSAEAESTINATATQEEGYIRVAITSELLKKHENGEGTRGYWAGFAVLAPEGATHLKYAFGANDEIALGDAAEITEVVTADGKKGIAFYADAGSETPKTVAKLQWFNGEDALSAETKFVMELSGIVKDEPKTISPETVCAAILSADAESTINATATQAEGYIKVDITSDLLKKHANGAEEPVEGYWAGFAVTAPEGATHLKYAFGTNDEIALGDAAEITEVVTADGKKGIAFYADAGDKNAKTYAKLQWFKAEEPISLETTFVMNFDGINFDEDFVKRNVYVRDIDKKADPETVNLDYVDYDDDVSVDFDKVKMEYFQGKEITVKPEFSLANVADSNENTEERLSSVYKEGTYKVTVNYEEKSAYYGIIHISMEDLVMHKNGNQEDGFWTGFKVTAPEGAKYLRYNKYFGSSTDGEIEFTDEDRAVDFYVNTVTDDHKSIEFLWLDENRKPLSPVAEYYVDLSNVDINNDVIISEANVCDSFPGANAPAKVYETYSVETELYSAEYANINIKMTGLALHRNGNKTPGYWTGFKVTGPENAAYFTYEKSYGAESYETHRAEGNEESFYFDVENMRYSREYIEIQFFDAEDRPITRNVHYNIFCNEADLKYPERDTVTATNIADNDGDVTELYEEGTYKAELMGNTIKLSAENLKAHTNGNGKEGHWIGFAVKAPEGATHYKYHFSNRYSGIYTEQNEPKALEEGEDSISFYVNASDPYAKDYLEIRWYSDATDPESYPNIHENLNWYYSYYIDTTEVDLYDDKAVTASPAVIADNKTGEVPYEGEFTATEEDGAIKFAVNGLKTHFNGNNDLGAWVGISISKPEDAAKVKYSFDYYSDWRYDARYVAAEEVLDADGEKISFYADAFDPEYKNIIMIQWFDENDVAITNVKKYYLDLSAVDYKVTEEKALTVEKADIVDQENPGIDPFIGEYDAKLADDNKTIILSADLLKMHKNGENRYGSWIGFKASVEGAKYLKYVFVNYNGDEEYEEDNMNWYWHNDAVQAELADGYEAFYVNASRYYYKNRVMLQWFDENGKALTNVNTYKIDINNVNLPESFEVLYSGIELTGTHNRFYNLVSNDIYNGLSDDEFIDWVSTEDYVYILTEVQGNGTAVIKVEGEDESCGGNVFFRNSAREVTLVATPASGYSFAGWYERYNTTVKVSGDASYKVKLNDCYNLIAKFTSASIVTGGGGGSGAYVTRPETSVKAGKVEKGTKVELSTKTKDAVIYYTLDGTTPTDKSAVYSEAIVINEDTIIKAIAIQGKMKSAVLTAKFTVKEEEKPQTAAPEFADLAGYGWADEAIKALAVKGIIKGVSDTAFAPANDIKRADYMLLLVRMLNLKAEVKENFDDVSADKYYYEGVGIAKALGLTTGVGDNKFNPEANITRQDMFVLAYRILEMQKAGLIKADESTISTFNDYLKIADYAKDALASLVKNELVKGSDNNINPVGNATRAETAVFIYRLYNLLNK